MCILLCMLELIAVGMVGRFLHFCSCVCWAEFQGMTPEPLITVSPKLPPPAV